VIVIGSGLSKATAESRALYFASSFTKDDQQNFEKLPGTFN